MPWTRASELARAIACPVSTVLPRFPDISGPAAVFGRELHAWKAGEPPTARVEGWLSQQDDPDPRAVLWPGGHHEVLVGCSDGWNWAWAEGTPDQRNLARANLDNSWAAGEADWVELALPWVDDLKTGGWGMDWAHPAALAQLRLYGLAVARMRQEGAVLLSVTHWPRYPLGSPPTRVTEAITRDELESWWGTVEHARTHPLTLNPGPHCRYCKCACAHRGKV